MSVDRDEVRRIAELAKLSLDEAEADRLAEEMTRILGYAERLRSVGSETVSGGHGGVDGKSGPDADAHEHPAPRPQAAPDRLAHDLADFAPEMHEGFFTVPPPPGVSAEDS